MSYRSLGSRLGIGRTAAGVAFAALAFSLMPSLALAALHPGDRVNVTVFGHPELTTLATVDAAGNVAIPVAGPVHAENLETGQLARAIKLRLAPYLAVAAVDVQLTAQNDAVFISGGPGGVLGFHPGETLLSVLDELQVPTADRAQAATNPHDIAAAGGAGGAPATQNETAITGTQNFFDGPVDYRHVSVLRDAKKFGPYDVIAMRSAGEPGIALQPNDTIQLPDKPVAVRVEGEVLHPGYAYLNTTEPLLRAIDQVGGPADLASQTDIKLTRAGASQTVALGSPAFSEPAQTGDAIVVTRAPRVDVLGTVVRPGETFLRGNQTLVSAIYYAGGPDKYANLKSVQVMRDGVKTEYNLANLRKGHGGDNPMLQDGDVVFVPQGSTLDAATIFQAIGSLGYFLRPL